LRAYYCALGRFVDTFARVELAAHLTLRHYAKMSRGAGRALLSGVRVDETRNRLLRLFEAGLMGEADWEDAAPIFQQLGTINGRRNDILHHGAIDVAQGFGVVTNAEMALTFDRVTEFSISPEILDDMTADLRKIMLRLYTRHMGRPAQAEQQPELDAISRAPWRYTLQPSPPELSRKAGRLGRTTKPIRPAQPKPPRD